MALLNSSSVDSIAFSAYEVVVFINKGSLTSSFYKMLFFSILPDHAGRPSSAAWSNNGENGHSCPAFYLK